MTRRGQLIIVLLVVVFISFRAQKSQEVSSIPTEISAPSDSPPAIPKNSSPAPGEIISYILMSAALLVFVVMLLEGWARSRGWHRHILEPTDTEGHAYECTICGKIIVMDGDW